MFYKVNCVALVFMEQHDYFLNKINKDQSISVHHQNKQSRLQYVHENFCAIIIPL